MSDTESFEGWAIVELMGHRKLAGYAPPIIGGVPYKADGTPAAICAGWLMRRVKEVHRQDTQQAAGAA